MFSIHTFCYLNLVVGVIGHDTTQNIDARLDRNGKKLSEVHHQKTGFCLSENDTDKLCSNCTADQRLCFHHTDNTFPLLLKSKISSF